jgi:hypothetical protein
MIGELFSEACLIYVSSLKRQISGEIPFLIHSPILCGTAVAYTGYWGISQSDTATSFDSFSGENWVIYPPLAANLCPGAMLILG